MNKSNIYKAFCIFPLSLAFSICAHAQVVSQPGADLQSGENLSWQAGQALTGDQQSRVEVRNAVRQLLESDRWAQIDPTFSNTSGYALSVFQFGNRFVARIKPQIHGISVQGADRVLRLRDKQWTVVSKNKPLSIRGQFALSKEEAIHIGAAVVPGNLFIDTTVERLGGIAKKVFWATSKGVRPAFQMRIPALNLRNASDVWVDADNGQFLQRQPVALFQGMNGDAGIPDTDAGPDADAGNPGESTDGGTDQLEDSGSPNTDDSDAGQSPDSGPSGSNDAGGPSTDSGAVDTDDAGPSPDDAGTSSDAGSTNSDAGSTNSDAGQPSTDAPSNAKVFVWWPDPLDLDEDDLVEVNLPGLRPAPIGGYLRGDYIETFNCCKEYVCLDGGNECNMNDPKVARCATPDDLEPLTSQTAIEVPADIIPFPFPSDVLYANVAFCAELPRAQSRPADGENPAGWYETPVDSQREINELLGLASEEDAFSEIQVYYAAMQFFLHLRTVLEDETFCLQDSSMICDDDGNLITDGDGHPERAYHIAVNGLSPDIDLNEIGGQVLGGAGQSPGNPLVIDDYMRLDNAVFLPAFSSGPLEVPEELSALADVFNREYDSNIFFQGVNDFAYDGSIVFHEFGHGIVHTFNSDLLQASRDSYGINGDPGALNEGWADYFASSFSGDSKMGTYGAFGFFSGEVGLRDADNEKVCPDNITGEVHDDSEPWTGALWEIRAYILDDLGDDGVARLDSLLWGLVAEADNDETMSEHAQRTLGALQEEFGLDTANAANDIFASRQIIDCVRVYDLSRIIDDDAIDFNTKDRLYLYAPDQVGLDRAPSAIQFRVELPAGSPGFELHWKQGTLLQEEFGGEPQTMRLLVHEDTGPIQWTYEGENENLAVPYDSSGRQITFNHDQDYNKANMADPTLPSFGAEADPSDCEDRSFYISFVNAEGGNPILTDIYVDLLPAEAEACDNIDGVDGGGSGRPVTPDEDEAADCACDETGQSGNLPESSFALLGLMSLMALRRRLRHDDSIK
jgi:hypothetical protein